MTREKRCKLEEVIDVTLDLKSRFFLSLKKIWLSINQLLFFISNPQEPISPAGSKSTFATSTTPMTQENQTNKEFVVLEKHDETINQPAVLVATDSSSSSDSLSN